ncbi:putative major capsid protein [Ralstonia phage phiRSP]|uniref:Putative major capsid protein n=1 Tax=Ralstonia phage phiRSP TaxID=2201420 RepID=A0A345ANT0_9CAUD|nr:major head protein [Ralstonia phage phiRSP]AXF38219.1 putative major capsid protein [Ralstonia phage phiRSP]
MKNYFTRDNRGTAGDSIATRLQEIKQRGGLKREATLGDIDLAARTVELSFSSEVEYRRWFGIEVLSHDANAVDLSRLNSGAALLWNHDWDDQRGVVESARIDGDRKGRAVVRFSKSPAGEQLMQDVADKIITKVSVGYAVNGMKLTEEREDTDVYLVTDWEPYEISLVSVPADDTVGVGRSAEIPPMESPAKPADNPTQDQTRTNPKGIQYMEKILRDASGNLVRAKLDEAGNIVQVLEVIERAGEAAAAAQARGAADVQARIRGINQMAETYGNRELALQYIAEGKTLEEFQRALMDKFVAERSQRPLTEQAQEANLGMSKSEVRRFSIFRAVRALLPTATDADRKAAAFEFECSRAAEKQYGKQSKGIMIPADVLNDRTFSTTDPAGGPGSNVVAQNLLAGSFIELLRNKAWLLKYATTMGGLVGNVDIPRQNAATQAYWVGEGGAPGAGEPGLDQIHFTPKTLGATTDITRRLMEQSTPDAELIVRNDILRVMALALDKAGIYGTGTTYQPKGLKFQNGIHATAFATAAKPTYAELVDMETKIALDNADVDSMVYACNAGIRGYAKTALKFPATAASGTIWEPGNTMNGYNTAVSNQIATGDVFFGNWADFVVAMWSGLDLMVDPYSLSTSGGTRIVALQDVDFNIRHPESFTYGA